MSGRHWLKDQSAEKYAHVAQTSHMKAEHVKRHDDMADYMQRVGEQPAELSVEEQKEQTKGNEQQAASMIRRQTGSCTLGSL